MAANALLAATESAGRAQSCLRQEIAWPRLQLVHEAAPLRRDGFTRLSWGASSAPGPSLSASIFLIALSSAEVIGAFSERKDLLDTLENENG